jgi:murein DD-endopeptidase MepM/ murein hydrolase activator NlpD
MVSSRVQAATAVGLVLTILVGAGAGAAAVRSHAQLAAKAEIMALELADARNESARAQQELALLAAGEDTGSEADTSKDSAALAQRIADRIKTLQQQLQAANDRQAALKEERAKLASQTGQLKNQVGQLEQAKTKDEKSLGLERDQLRQKVAELQNRLQTHNGGHLIVMGGKADSTAPAQGAASESFDLDSLMAKLGVGAKRKGAEGGPYVALGSGKAGEQAATDPEAQAMLKTLPLSAPLDGYQFESSFGVRVDPFNGHRSMHTGLDLSASYKAPVYSTSAGDVVFAGYAGAYGKMVEIDHGHGIHTRYGHLNRLMVNVGQHVSQHTEIGLLGSTGRSTGPHVHYEILVNGTAQNPMRFLDAGKSLGVVKAAE